MARPNPPKPSPKHGAKRPADGGEGTLARSAAYLAGTLSVLGLAGGLLGCLTGYGFTAFTSLDWPIVVGGKPLFHMIPYTIIAFELTVLFGALATVLGLFINARLPRVALETVYDPSFTNDTIGVFVHCGPDRVAAAQDLLTRAGAPEVRHA